MFQVCLQYRAKGDGDTDGWSVYRVQGDGLQQRGICGGLAGGQDGEIQSWVRTLCQYEQ